MDYLQYINWTGVIKWTVVAGVLNLIINGLPSIPQRIISNQTRIEVLNLIINGLPSILKIKI